MKTAVTIRASALIVMLSVSAAAVAPLLCEIGCMSPQSASQSCHDDDSRTRVSASAAHHACDHTADGASLFAAASKIEPITIDTQVAEPHSFGRRPPAALIARHHHGPPGSPPAGGSFVRTILRI